MQLVLRTGDVLRVRPIRKADKLLLAEAVTRLSEDARHKRFLGPKPRLTARELRYLTEVDGVHHVALVAVSERHPDLILASARFVRDARDPSAAEVAVTVADHLQGLGVGTSLGLALADLARERGITRFTATMLHDNAPAHRLFARLTGRLDVRHEGGVDEVSALLPAA